MVLFILKSKPFIRSVRRPVHGGHVMRPTPKLSLVKIWEDYIDFDYFGQAAGLSHLMAHDDKSRNS